MTLDQMNEDLKRFDDFEQMSDRVGYWSRRFRLSKPTEKQDEEFDAIVSVHAQRVLGVMRAG